jgi:uncharacterized protein YjeT (DUF2065 family)
MLYNFVIAIALLLLLEGILPFAAPQFWRRMVVKLAEQSDNTLRIAGFIAMLVGLVILFFVNTLWLKT